jgi:hypothetical protein
MIPITEEGVEKSGRFREEKDKGKIGGESV